MNFKKIIRKNYINAIGWSTKRRLLIIESDDWGSIRMPDLETYKKALKLGLKVDENNYDSFDAIESDEDLNSLFDVLSVVRDRNCNSPCITACTIVANPHFEKIEAADRKKYYYEPFTETYKRFKKCSNSFKLFTEGIESNIFYPQFHGREHINVNRYLAAINSKSIKENFCFAHNSILGSLICGDEHHTYFGALDYTNKDEEDDILTAISEGISIFQTIFGFSPKSYVTPTNHHGWNVNKYFSENGIHFSMGGQQFVRKPDGKLKKINYKWGTRDENNITYWRRNCTFEPSRNQEFDWVSSCLKEIEIAFRWGKPAVINSHRVNYIGNLNENNRTQSLVKLRDLLKSVLKKWPDVEFINSESLATIIEDSKRVKKNTS